MDFRGANMIESEMRDRLVAKNAEIDRLRAALEAVLVGVNHIATYRTDRWPEPGTDHWAALEMFGAGREYDMWCCWNAAMRNRDALPQLSAAWRVEK